MKNCNPFARLVNCVKPVFKRQLILFVLITIFVFKTNGVKCQTAIEIENVRAALIAHPQLDTARVNRLNALAFIIRKLAAVESSNIYLESEQLAKKLNYIKGLSVADIGLGFYYRFANLFTPAINYTQLALNNYKTLKDTTGQITCYYNLSAIYKELGKLEESMAVDFEALKLAEATKNKKWLTLVNNHLGNNYADIGENQKSRYYTTIALDIAKKAGDNDGILHCLQSLGTVCANEGKWQEAQGFFMQGETLAKQTHDMQTYYQSMLNVAFTNERLGKYAQVIMDVDSSLIHLGRIQFYAYHPFGYKIKSRTYLRIGKNDSCIKYGLLSFYATQHSGQMFNTMDISQTLASAYANLKNYKEAYHYQELFTNYKDSTYAIAGVRNIATLEFANDMEKKQAEIKLLTKDSQLVKLQNKQQKIWLVFVIVGLIVVALVGVVFFISNRKKQQLNKLLQQQQDDLKAAQKQLVQSEKLASLGELTAGIAHEIQNPLNFVNNFSEVSIELIDEMEQELNNGDKDEAIAIAGDIKQNLAIIRNHGKRADFIVKGMLQHSRASTGERQPTNINMVADEFLKLSFHGLRAKDKGFNTELITRFDESLPKLNVVQQDIGRVLLNIFNNALYAVQQKQKLVGENYKAAISVQTLVNKGFVLIKIKDNGIGMADNIKEKIMQPFFTTKPAGEGTGLGLSLSYDIIVKGHGGNISVDSKQGEGSEFIVSLPIN